MAESTGVSDLKGLGDFAGMLLGSSSSSSSNLSGTTTNTGSTTGREKLNIDQAGIDKIIQDVLGGADGLAAIFSGEQSAGVFNSSVAAQASGDLAAKLVGEIAKLTAEKETSSTTNNKQIVNTKQTSEEEEEGLIEGLFSGIGDFLKGDKEKGSSGGSSSSVASSVGSSTPAQSIFGNATNTSGSGNPLA